MRDVTATCGGGSIAEELLWAHEILGQQVDYIQFKSISTSTRGQASC